MFQHNINMLKDAKVSRVANAASAAQTAVTSAVLDMQGFDSVVFIALLGDVTTGSVLTLTGKGNSAASTSSPTPKVYPGAPTFTAGASDADNKVMILDIQKPRDRYVFAELTRTTANAVVDGIIAIRYNSHERPLVDQDVSVLVSALLNDPAGA